MKPASKFWELLHEAASHIPVDSDLYSRVSAILDEGVDAPPELRSAVLNTVRFKNDMQFEKVSDVLAERKEP